MDQGKIQIYDKPERSSWKNPTAWVVLTLSLLAGLGVYTAYF